MCRFVAAVDDGVHVRNFQSVVFAVSVGDEPEFHVSVNLTAVGRAFLPVIVEQLFSIVPVSQEYLDSIRVPLFYPQLSGNLFT